MLERPLTELTVKELAESSGLSFWATYRGPTRTQLIRIAILELVKEVSEHLQEFREQESTVHETIRAYVEHIVDVVSSSKYVELAYLLIRDGRTYPWLKEEYEEQIVQPFCRKLEEAVRSAGVRYGAWICFKDDVPRRTLRKLESVLTLPLLLPGAEAPSEAERQEVALHISRQLMSATYAPNFSLVAA